MSDPHESAPPPPPSSPPPADGWSTDHLRDYRSLRRSATDRKVAGVAGGLARHLDVDPIILRVLFVVLIFFGGSGLLLYGVMWLIVPDEATGRAPLHSSDSTRNALLIGALVLGALLAIGDTWNGYGFPWPLAVAALVVFAVLLGRDSRRAHRSAAGPWSGQSPVPAPGSPQGPPPSPRQGPTPGYVSVPPSDPAAAFSASAPPASTAPYPPSATASAATPTGPVPAGAVPPSWYPPVPRPPVPRPPAKPRKRGPLLFGPTLALVAIGLGTLGLFDASGVDVTDAAYPALALAIVGVMLVVGSVFGRPGGLVLLGVVCSLALGGAAIGNPSYDGERDLLVRPTSAALVKSGYRVPAGRIELDLTRVRDLSALDGRSIVLDANVGEIVLDVPDDVVVDYDAAVGFGGAIDAPGVSRGGWNIVKRGAVNTARGEPKAEIDVDLDLDFGHIELRRR